MAQPMEDTTVFGRWEATMKIHMGTDFCDPPAPASVKTQCADKDRNGKDMKSVVMLQIGTNVTNSLP